MKRTGSPLLAALTASLAAGPLFFFFLTCASLYEASVHGISFDSKVLAAVPFMLFFSLLAGSILGLVPNYAGTWLMIGLARLSDAFRAPIAWSLVGALAGAPIGWLFLPPRDGGELIFAFAATGASCAAICRRWMAWEPV